MKSLIHKVSSKYKGCCSVRCPYFDNETDAKCLLFNKILKDRWIKNENEYDGISGHYEYRQTPKCIKMTGNDKTVFFNR